MPPFSCAFVKGWRRSITMLTVAQGIKELDVQFTSLSQRFKAGKSMSEVSFDLLSPLQFFFMISWRPASARCTPLWDDSHRSMSRCWQAGDANVVCVSVGVSVADFLLQESRWAASTPEKLPMCSNFMRQIDVLERAGATVVAEQDLANDMCRC